jgi:tRNA threonylcarbamoyladenosine modification (KEOPS) complex  Pcc1 subunit
MLYATLGPLVAGRCYPLEFPQAANGPIWPAIRYSVVEETPEASVCGTNTGVDDQVRVQLDIVARDYSAMRTLKTAVLQALTSVSPPHTRDAGFEMFDAETKTHRAVLFVTFQPSSA